MMEHEDGLLLKVNPPLRARPVPAVMLRRLLAGEIDWIETDHAPHTRKDKAEDHASGFPGFPFYPGFLKLLSENGMPKETVSRLTHDAICRAFGVTIAVSGRTPDLDLAREYPFDPYAARELTEV
jgi:dihydroorotase